MCRADHRGDASLLLEARDARRLVRMLGEEHLDRHVLAQAPVHTEVHLANPTSGDEAGDFVLRFEDLTFNEGHGGSRQKGVAGSLSRWRSGTKGIEGRCAFAAYVPRPARFVPAPRKNGAAARLSNAGWDRRTQLGGRTSRARRATAGRFLNGLRKRSTPRFPEGAKIPA